jgi:hypothetical protein
MRSPGERRRRRRFLRPNAFFLGIACSFLTCCVAGRVVSRHNIFQDFERLHIYLNPSTYFYPTASQVLELGRAKLPSDKIAVVIGGNSVLYGVGQTPDELWTRKLQARLGDEYRVLNLGLWGAYPAEFGGTAADMLRADHPRLIFVTDVRPGCYPAEIDGVLHRFLFWDAYYKGLLQHDAERETVLARQVAARHDQPAFSELRDGARLNSLLWFNDLWTDVAYNHCGTVWNSGMIENWYVRRRKLRDTERTAPPPGQRYPPEFLDKGMEIARGCLFYNGCRKDEKGHWVDDADSPVWTRLLDNARPAFAEADRRATLIVVHAESPHYVNRLSADDRELYYALSRTTTRRLEEGGFAAVEMGDKFPEEEFRDHCHLAESGGARLAEMVAGRIQRMAVDLGMTHDGAGEKR